MSIKSWGLCTTSWGLCTTLKFPEAFKDDGGEIKWISLLDRRMMNICNKYSMSTSERSLNYALCIANNLNRWTFLLVARVEAEICDHWSERDFEDDDEAVLSQWNENKLFSQFINVDDCLKCDRLKRIILRIEKCCWLKKIRTTNAQCWMNVLSEKIFFKHNIFHFHSFPSCCIIISTYFQDK